MMETTKGKSPAQLGEEGVKEMRVMVGIDESDESFHALQWTLDHLCGRITGTAAANQDGLRLITLSLVHVHQGFHRLYVPAGPGGTAYYIPASVEESIKKGQEQISKALLSRASYLCKDRPNAAVETLIFEGDPKEKICRATQEMHVDHLVVGNRNLGKIKRAFLGSVSDYCAHHANCPVLIVKQPSKEVSK
ncbi:universal stress protein PHOS34-like isoform X2 [Hibiscus syriacus]|uniref:universal stress protein PHOS34-like isoform X2 n=1 Tax=Hibiscus syriacus TaxID=106335 RepID=UPI001922D89F|nr:universal stress protein PHOS34-like isoform X2 [Hibiscus syriacus]